MYYFSCVSLFHGCSEVCPLPTRFSHSTRNASDKIHLTSHTLPGVIYHLPGKFCGLFFPEPHSSSWPQLLLEPTSIHLGNLAFFSFEEDLPWHCLLLAERGDKSAEICGFPLAVRSTRLTADWSINYRSALSRQLRELTYNVDIGLTMCLLHWFFFFEYGSFTM